MPIKHGPRRRRDSTLYRVLLLSDDDRKQTPLDVAYSVDGLKDVLERNKDTHKGNLVIEKAELPDDLQWQGMRRL